jgi:hypothetical protein
VLRLDLASQGSKLGGRDGRERRGSTAAWLGLAEQEEEERAASDALMSARGEREGGEDGRHYSKRKT